MNQPSVTRLPMAAMNSLGNASLLAVKSAWAQYMKAPMAASGLIVFAVGALVVSSNALYGQPNVHPSPFFFDASARTTAAPNVQTPVTPAVMTDPIQTTREIAPSSVNPAPIVSPAVTPAVEQSSIISGSSEATVTNEKLARAQSILQSLGMFSGKVDGFYGPQTAEAIRAFELRAGLSPKGALDAAVIDRILRSSSIDVARPPAVAPPVDAVETVAPVVATTPTVQTAGSGQAALQSLVGDTQSSEQIVPQTTPAPLTTIEPEPIADAELAAATTPANVEITSKAYIEAVQKGLASLAFLQGSIDGVAGESTAKAIRNFEVFYNYEVTGAITPELLDMLVGAGATVE